MLSFDSHREVWELVVGGEQEGRQMFRLLGRDGEFCPCVSLDGPLLSDGDLDVLGH